MDQPRGILPTYVTQDHLLLAKASPTVRNTYEIRLAIYFAMQRDSAFTLMVPPHAELDANLEAYLAERGGEILREEVEEFSVTFGAEDADGEELDTWVLGDQSRWWQFLCSLKSSWLKQRLCLGIEIAGNDLDTLAAQIGEEDIEGTNADGEPLKPAILTLVATAQASNGRVVLQ